MNPHIVESNTTNRNLQAQTAPAEPAVAENPPPLLDVQPVEVPQAVEIRAELAAVEDLADHQSIEAKEEGVGKCECLSVKKTFLENLLSLAPELQSKILGQMHMQSLDDLDPLLEVIAQEIQELRALEDAQRPAEKILNLRQLAQLALESGNCTPQLSASIAALLKTIDQEVPVLQALGGEEGPASKIVKLRALAHLAVENVLPDIDAIDLTNHNVYLGLMELTEELSAIKKGALGNFRFQFVKEILINSSQVDLLPRFFSSMKLVTIHARDINRVSDYWIRTLMQLSNLKRLGLQYCHQLTDISALGQLSNLKTLVLEDCHQLTDISALGQLSNLKRLGLQDCDELTDISVLGQLSNLTWLGFSCHQLTDISPLANLRGLTNLYLGNCKGITDISPLRYLNHLQELNVTGCPLDEASRELLEDLRNKNVKVQFE